MLLSFALPPVGDGAAAAATAAVNRWKAARQLLLDRAPAECNDWETAGSAWGREALWRACGTGSAGTLVSPWLEPESRELVECSEE